MICFTGAAQKIIVDTTSTNKYLIERPAESPNSDVNEEELSFSDRAMSIGVGIMNRLKARLNLEEATESLKEKKEKFLGKKEEETVSKKDEGDG